MLVSHDPAVLTALIGLLGVGAVVLAYRFCDEHFDRRTAQVTALLFAAAPWAVVFSRKMQAQDVVPFFTLLWLGAIFQFVRGRGAHHLLGVAIWLTILLQLHLASVALIPLSVLALAPCWRRFGEPAVIRWAGAAVLVAALLWLPFIAFQITHNLADVHALLRVMRQPPQFSVDQFPTIADMATTNAYAGLTGVGYEQYHAETFSFDGLYLVERVLFVAGLALLAGRLIATRGRKPGDWRLALILLWLVVPPLFFVRHTTPLFPHYFLDVFPAQFIVIGLLVTWATTNARLRRPAIVPGLAAAGLVAALVGSQVYGLFALMDFVGRAPTLGGHGVPLREREEAIARAATLAGGSAKPVYVASSGQDYPSAFAYLANDRLTLKIFDDRDTFVAPADDGKPTLYLTSDPNQPAARLLDQRFGDRQVALIPYPGQATGFAIYRLGSDVGVQLLGRADLRTIGRTLPNGMRLIGYEVDPTIRAGQLVRLGVYWQVVALPPPGKDYAFFNHLVDARGHVWGQEDGLGYLPTYWKLGDVVVSWFTLPASADLPAGPGWIESGVYDRDGIVRQPLRAADGTSVDHLLLGPIKLVPASTAAVPAPSHAQTAHFGAAIDLVGYDLNGDTHPGGTLRVTLTWAARATPDADDTTFVHLLDPDGRLVAQSDGQPGPYPTTLWQAGDVTRDERDVVLPRDLHPGEYRLFVGLYRRDTLARISTPSGDEVILGTLVVD
jgi:hypothetical protein